MNRNLNVRAIRALLAGLAASGPAEMKKNIDRGQRDDHFPIPPNLWFTAYARGSYRREKTQPTLTNLNNML